MKFPVRNSLYNLATQGVAVLAALVCVPIAFRELGTERFGLLTIVWSLLSYSIVFDLGTGPAVARATASSLAADGGRRIRAIVRAGLAVQLVLGLFAGAILAALAPWMVSLLRVPASYTGDATMALYALALGIPVILVTQSLQAVLEGLERFDLLACARIPLAALTYAVPAAGAIAGWSLARMITVIVLARAIAAIVLFAFYRTSRPMEQRGRAREEWRGLYQYGRWLAVSGVLTQVLLYLDRFLLSAMHGLTAVALYAAPYDAASKLLTIPGSIGVAMFPGLAKDKARDRKDEALMRSRAAGRVVMLVLVPLGLALIATAAPLLRWWLGPDFGTEGIAAFRILVFAVVLHAAAFPPVIAIEAFGRSDVVARYYLWEILVYVPAAILAIHAFGVTGAAWIWAARTAALMVWSHWYASRKL